MSQYAQQGRIDAFRSLGLIKCAGYYQNVVGVNDIRPIEKHRENLKAYLQAEEEFKNSPEYKEWDEKYQRARQEAYKKYPEVRTRSRFLGRKIPEAMATNRQRSADRIEYIREQAAARPEMSQESPSLRAKDLRGSTDFGYMPKYMGVPDTLANYASDPMSGTPVNKGYLTREEFLYSIAPFESTFDTAEQKALLEKLRNSNYRYVTSTDVL
jgi:hypothetical protein